MAGSWELTYDRVLLQTECVFYSIRKLSVLYDKTNPDVISSVRLKK